MFLFCLATPDYLCSSPTRSHPPSRSICPSPLLSWLYHPCLSHCNCGSLCDSAYHPSSCVQLYTPLPPLRLHLPSCFILPWSPITHGSIPALSLSSLHHRPHLSSLRPDTGSRPESLMVPFPERMLLIPLSFSGRLLVVPDTPLQKPTQWSPLTGHIKSQKCLIFICTDQTVKFTCCRFTSRLTQQHQINC